MATTSGSLQIKDGKYYAVLSFRTDELQPNGKPKFKTKWFSTGYEVKGNKKKAQKFLADKCAEYDSKNLNYSEVKFTDYMKIWLENIKPELRPSTYRGYSGNIKNHIIPYFARKRTKLQDLTTWELEDFYSYLITNNSKTDGSEHLSPTTIKHIHRTISKALNDGVRRGILYYNVASSAKTPKAERYKSEFLNQEQVQELLKLFKNSVIEIPVMLCAVFGFRRGEVLGLKWHSIDMVKHTITVSEALQQHIGGSITVAPKTDSSYRTLPIPDTVYRLLQKHKQEQLEMQQLLKDEYIKSDYVCTWQNGRVIEPNYLTREFHKVISASDLPTIRLHDLRHSVASNLLNMGFTVVQVAEWLGHSSSATTLNYYAHTDKTSKMNISKSIDTVFSE